MPCESVVILIGVTLHLLLLYRTVLASSMKEYNQMTLVVNKFLSESVLRLCFFFKVWREASCCIYSFDSYHKAINIDQDWEAVAMVV